ncbi:MAG TPA: S41 family peptidase [Clostridiales bacterium]|nr:S41 family peptidase [Clostridiales bacterium]HPV02294.1 S41 family peptidase [Clostridiales bacterium]
MRRLYTFRQVAVIVAVTLVFSVSAAAFVFYSVKAAEERYMIIFDADSVDYSNVLKFNRVMDILRNDFYQKVDTNKMLEGAINGLAESLGDPYTVYFDKEHMEAFLEKSRGSYVGIGVTVNVDDDGLLTVVEPMRGSPAMEAGMRQGDKIVKVDGKDVTSIRDENMIISMIKGKENTRVKITVYRPSENRYVQFDIKRKRIRASNIKSEILEGNIGYIRIVMFDSEIADYFKSDLNSMLKKGIKGLVIDLRDNPGGSFEQVVEIADSLLPAGTIVYTEDREGRKEYRYSDTKYTDIPLVILINGNSASASEILAGAIRDHGRGKLVGTRTFGKGLVQELKLLGDGSGLKVTISRYFTPSGVCIQGTGIEPDIHVGVLDEYRNLPASQIPRDRDIQLRSAIEALLGEIE